MCDTQSTAQRETQIASTNCLHCKFAHLILQGETEIVDLITLKLNEKNLNNILN